MSQDHTNYIKVTLPDEHSVKIPTADSSQVYVVNKRKLLGKGKFGQVYEGQVYEGHLYDIHGQTPVKKVAIKAFDLNAMNPKTGLSIVTKESIQKEACHLRKSFQTEEAFFREEEGLGYIVTEYIPGKELGKIDPTSTRCVRLETVCGDLPFEERAQLLWYLMLKLNHLHHNSLLSEFSGRKTIASAIVHGDIKPTNILVDIINKKIMGVEFVDRGCSDEIDDAPEAQIKASYGGSQFWVSPEVNKQQKIGRKTDLRSMVPIILGVLGVEQPFHLSYQPWCEFDITSLYSIRDIPCEIKPFLVSFLKRMAAEEYNVRPDTDECLKFITAVRNYAFAKPLDKTACLEKMQEVAEPGAKSISFSV